MLKWEKKVFDKYPQFQAPEWLLTAMDKVLPSYCIFERTIRIKDTLICYIPSLCRFNPFFNSLMTYRLAKAAPFEGFNGDGYYSE